jgi:hypothetical protein
MAMAALVCARAGIENPLLPVYATSNRQRRQISIPQLPIPSLIPLAEKSGAPGNTVS